MTKAGKDKREGPGAGIELWRLSSGGGGSGGGGGSAFSLALAGAGLEAVWRRNEFDLGEILDASVGHSEVCLKLGHSCLKGEDPDFHCRRLRITGGAGRVRGIFLKPVFRQVEAGIVCFEDFGFGFEGTHAGRGAS